MKPGMEGKRKKEQRVLKEMIVLYCRSNHPAVEGRKQSRGQLCPKCQLLFDYARERSERCPFIEQKTFCANCRVHCYKPEMREEILCVMRFSGPRIIFSHPILAVWHLACSIQEKKRNKKDD